MTRFEELGAIESGVLVPPGDIPDARASVGTDPREILQKFVAAFMAYIECPSWHYITMDVKSDFSKEPISKEPVIYEKEGLWECVVTTGRGATKYRAKAVEFGVGHICVVVHAGFKAFVIESEEDIGDSMEPLYHAQRRTYQRSGASKRAKASAAGTQ